MTHNLNLKYILSLTLSIIATTITALCGIFSLFFILLLHLLVVDLSDITTTAKIIVVILVFATLSLLIKKRAGEMIEKHGLYLAPELELTLYPCAGILFCLSLLATLSDSLTKII